MLLVLEPMDPTASVRALAARPLISRPGLVLGAITLALALAYVLVGLAG